MSVTIRFWQKEDAGFVLKCRNHPDLQKWFRQDRDITMDEQLAFMARRADYKGYIIEVDGVPAGVCSLVGGYEATDLEFGIALLPEYQGKGIAKEAMRLMCQLGFTQFQAQKIHSEVFIKNPALPFYLWKCGFKAVGVRERQYWKKDIGFVDVVLIERGKA